MENGKMKISVIVPIYNAGDYIEECIKSIVNQTYQSLEIILINDGSTDCSGEICEKYASLDKRIVYLTQENQGVVYTRQRGISIAHGEYITFVDADDYIEPEMYQVLVQKMDNRCADIVAYDIVEEDEETSRVSRNLIPCGFYEDPYLNKNVYSKMLSGENYFSFGIRPTVFSKLFRKDFLDKANIKIDETITLGEDVALTFQALVQVNSLQIIDYAPYHYVKRKGTMTWKPQGEDNIKRLENTLRDAFLYANKLDKMQVQLDEYITFIRLLKAPKTINKVADFFANQNRRVALYGAGGFGQAIFHEYGDRVSLWVDRDYKKYESLNGPVRDIEALNSNADQYDIIYIAIINENLSKQVKENLREKGIKKDIEFFCINDK